MRLHCFCFFILSVQYGKHIYEERTHNKTEYNGVLVCFVQLNVLFLLVLYYNQFLAKPKQILNTDVGNNTITTNIYIGNFTDDVNFTLMP